jgi:hypothetical protein
MSANLKLNAVFQRIGRVRGVERTGRRPSSARAKILPLRVSTECKGFSNLRSSLWTFVAGKWVRRESRGRQVLASTVETQITNAFVVAHGTFLQK